MTFSKVHRKMFHFVTSNCMVLTHLPTALAREVMQLPPFFGFHSNYELSDLWLWSLACAWVMTVALLGLKVKVRSEVKVRVRDGLRSKHGRCMGLWSSVEDTSSVY